MRAGNEREDCSPDPEWKRFRQSITAVVETSQENAKKSKTVVAVDAAAVAKAARLRSEAPRVLKKDSGLTAQADMASQHKLDERRRIAGHQAILEQFNGEYLIQHRRFIDNRQEQMKKQIEEAQERAARAAQHRKSLGTKALKGLYIQALRGDELVRVMFTLKLNFGVHKAAMKIGMTIMKAWAMHEMKCAICDMSRNHSKNKAYLAARFERQNAKRRTRAYGDAVFRNHPVLEAVFPIHPPSPRWYPKGWKNGTPIKWRLAKGGEIQRYLADPEQTREKRGGISPPRKPGYEMLRGDYA